MGETQTHPLMRERVAGLPTAAAALLERASAALDAQDAQTAETALNEI